MSKGTWMILFAAMLWGTTGTSQALAPAESTPAAIAALRMLLAGVVLFAWTVRSKDFHLKNWPVMMTLLAGALIALYQLMSFWAMSETGVAIGAVVAMGSAPVFAGILEYLIRAKKPVRRWYLSTVMAVSGCLFLVFDRGDVYVDSFGVFLALVAGFSYAFYTLSISMLVEKQAPQVVTAIVTCVGAFFLLPALFRTDLSWLSQTNGWVAIVHLGLIATALSYWLFAKGLKSVRTSTAVTLTLAEPLVATLLGVLVVGEKMNFLVSCGLILIFAALLLLMVPSRQKLLA